MTSWRQSPWPLVLGARDLGIDDGDGKYHYEVNKNETMLAREKQNMIKEKFKEWLFSEPERRQKYVEYYNETFNNIRLREYDGSHLQFPGMNPAIELKPHAIFIFFGFFWSFWFFFFSFFIFFYFFFSFWFFFFDFN